MYSSKLLNLIISFSLSFIILLSLGTWQLERLIWKKSLLKQISEQASLPLIDLSYPIIRNIKKYKSRKIKLEGNFLYDSNLTILSRVYKGKVGRHVIVPMKTKYGWVLVNTGFIPERNYADYLKKGYSASVRIEGIIHLPDYKSYFTPENNVNKGEWYYVNIEEIKKYVDLPLLEFIVFEGKSNNSGKFPVAGQYRYNSIPNNHFQYALTWFSLAIVLFIIVRIFWNKNL